MTHLDHNSGPEDYEPGPVIYSPPPAVVVTNSSHLTGVIAGVAYFLWGVVS